MKMIGKLILVVSLVLFATSLALPAIVFHPGVSTSTYDICAAPAKYVCSQQSQNTIVCGEQHNLPSDVNQSQLLSPSAVSQFCTAFNAGKPLDAYAGQVYQGWGVLIFGWLGSWAWFANVSALVAFILVQSSRRKSKAGLVFGLVSPVLGLLAFSFTAAYSDETGHLMYVDHLALGYYVWELSLSIFAAYCILTFFQRTKVAT